MGDVRRPSRERLDGGKERGCVEQTVRRLWNLNPSSRPFYNMSPNPVSILRRRLEEIVNTPALRKEYAIGAKTDGVRYMMVVTHDSRGAASVVLINRRAEMFVLRPRGVMPRNVAEEAAMASYTLGSIFDGELIATTTAEGEDLFEFWIFDTVAVRGATLRGGVRRGGGSEERPIYLRERQRVYQHFVTETQALFLREWGIGLCSKPFFPLTSDGYLQLQQWMGEEGHTTDGFILAPLDEIVRQGTQENMYKVKTTHTVDLKFHLDFGSRSASALSADLEHFKHPDIPKIVAASYIEIDYSADEDSDAREHLIDVQMQPTSSGDASGDASGLPSRQKNILAGYRVEIKDTEGMLERLGRNVHAAVQSGRAHAPTICCVIECLVRVPSSKHVIFEPLKIRPEKLAPNNARTLRETVQNAQEDITYEELQAMISRAERSQRSQRSQRSEGSESAGEVQECGEDGRARKRRRVTTGVDEDLATVSPS